MQKVLIVDNSPVLLKYMDAFLGKNGYSVKTAENGLVALDLVQSYIPDINVTSAFKFDTVALDKSFLLM